MARSPIVPCLWLDDQAEQAARFYEAIFPDSRIIGISRYPESTKNPSGKPPGSVLTVELELAGQRFTLLDGGPQFTMNPSVSFFVQVDSPDAADRLFSALSEKGQVMMPLDRYAWSERYAWVQDRFGASWQIITLSREVIESMIVPCLMFTGPAAGRAEEAMKAYTGIFPNGRVKHIERYGAGENGREGTVKHGRFVLDGQEMIAMDSPIEHGLSFNEGISLQVMCADQPEIDRYWEALSEGGEKGVCGWLKDRFGLSWQVVPEALSEWMTSDDHAGRDRAFQAMLEMKKLDIAALRTALEGR